MQEKTYKGAKTAFWILMIVYAVANIFDSAVLWDRNIVSGGWYNTLAHSIVTLGAGPIDSGLRLNLVSGNVGSAFPGILFCLFPMLSVVFGIAKKKAPAVVCAVLNLLIAAFLLLCVIEGAFILMTGWILYFISAIVLLVYAVGGKKAKKVAAVGFMAFGILSVFMFAGSMFLKVELIRYRVQLVDIDYAVKMLKRVIDEGGIYNSFMRSYGGLGIAFFPISRAVLYFALFAGMLCALRLAETQKTVPVKKPETYIAPEVADEISRQALSALKDITNLHNEGILTDEEFENKKAELLKKI